MKTLRKSLSRAWVSAPLVFVLFVLVWHFWIVLFDVSRFVVPPPREVLDGLVMVLTRGDTYQHLWFTVQGSAYGFALAALVGIFLGVLIGKLPALEQALNPFIVATQVVPKIAFVPLFILWFGFGVESKVFIAMLLSFFPMFTATVFGIKSVPRGHKDVMKSCGGGKFQMFRKLEMPSALPNILSGMEVGIVFAVIGAIVAEYLGGSKGLGYLAISRLNALQVAELFGVIIVMTIMGYTLYLIILWARRVATPWHESVRRD